MSETPVIEKGSTFYWKCDGIAVKVRSLYVDEDGNTQVRVQDGDNLLTLTVEDIRSRLISGVLVESQFDTLTEVVV